MDMRFICTVCHLDRNVRTELSTYSKTEITHGKRSTDIKLVCKYCSPPGTLPAIIEPPKDNVYVRDVDGGPVSEDRILSYKEAAAATGIPDGAFRKLVSDGIIEKYVFGSKKTDVGIKASELHRYMMTDAYKFRVSRGATNKPVAPPVDEPQRAALREQRREEAKRRPDPDPVKPKRKQAKDAMIKRNYLGLSQYEVADLTETSQTNISRFERGMSVPRYAYEAICEKFLEVTPPKPVAPPGGKKKFQGTVEQTKTIRRQPKPKPETNGKVDDAGAIRFRTVTQTKEVPVIPIQMPEEAVRPNALNPDQLLEQAQSMLQAGDIDLATKLMDLAMTLLARQRERTGP